MLFCYTKLVFGELIKMISVNLTTTNSRVDICSATVWSILNQELMPDKINVWVSKDAYLFDNGIQEIPLWVHAFNKIHNIVNFIFVENIGPYRKILPALMESKFDDTLVYCDDDVVYGKKWLKHLIEQYNKHNGEYAIAARVRCKRKNFFGVYKSYNLYPIVNKYCLLNKDYIITGVGGCVINKTFVEKKFLEDKTYLTIAAMTDDLWLSKIFELNNIKISVCTPALTEVHEITNIGEALSNNNTLIDKNNLVKKALKRIIQVSMGYFGFSLSNNDVCMKKIERYFSGE